MVGEVGRKADIARDELTAGIGQSGGSRWLTCHLPQ